MKRYLAIVSLILLSFISGCGEPPEKVLSEYLERTLTGDFLGAKSLCTGDAFEKTKMAEGATGALGGGIQTSTFLDWSEVEPHLTIMVEEKTKKKAEIFVSIKGYEIGTYTLVKVKGTWKISKAVFPATAKSIIEWKLRD